MSLDALIARLSPSQRADIAQELEALEKCADFRLDKTTTDFLEQLRDALREP